MSYLFHCAAAAEIVVAVILAVVVAIVVQVDHLAANVTADAVVCLDVALIDLSVWTTSPWLNITGSAELERLSTATVLHC